MIIYLHDYYQLANTSILITNELIKTEILWGIQNKMYWLTYDLCEGKWWKI